MSRTLILCVLAQLFLVLALALHVLYKRALPVPPESYYRRHQLAIHRLFNLDFGPPTHVT